jgi:predicted ArsR family transcriptional regulator
MKLSIDDNPTRQKIIMLLKKAEFMTVAELSREMGITPMAVRQHLMALERKGIVSYVTKKYGIGRPMFLYKLTEKANDIFPNSYGNFLLEVLRALDDMDGRGKIDKIFRVSKQSMLDRKQRALFGANDFTEKVVLFTELLEKDGFLVELEEKKDDFKLKMFNCLLPEVANEYPEACKYELELYRNLLNKNVSRSQSMRGGSPSCVYVIPKA